MASISIATEVQAFVDHVKMECEVNAIKLMLKRADHIKMGTLKVNGYFSDTDRVLAVALGRKKTDSLAWLHTLVHESCHMDQFMANSRVWRQKCFGADPSVLLGLWLNKVIDMQPNYLMQAVMPVLQIELDAEKRSVKKIKEWKLPFDTEEYTQKANAYVYFYHMIAQRREWYHIGTEPYNVEEVWKAMPTHFDNDYTELPPQFKRLYVEHCFKGIER